MKLVIASLVAVLIALSTTAVHADDAQTRSAEICDYIRQVAGNPGVCTQKYLPAEYSNTDVDCSVMQYRKRALVIVEVFQQTIDYDNEVQVLRKNPIPNTFNLYNSDRLTIVMVSTSASPANAGKVIWAANVAIHTVGGR